jgi:hypothetical protein
VQGRRSHEWGIKNASKEKSRVLIIDSPDRPLTPSMLEQLARLELMTHLDHAVCADRIGMKEASRSRRDSIAWLERIGSTFSGSPMWARLSVWRKISFGVD